MLFAESCYGILFVRAVAGHGNMYPTRDMDVIWFHANSLKQTNSAAREVRTIGNRGIVLTDFLARCFGHADVLFFDRAQL